MSVCDHYPTNENGSKSGSSVSQQEPNLILQDELIWGLSYRHYKKKENEVPIPPKKSPIDIPFKLCREMERQERKKSQHSSKKSKKVEKEPTLLEKSVMSQSQYMNYLSIPRKTEGPPPSKKRKRPCEIEPCPPRFVQLAVPNKRRVYENWKAYHEMLPTEVIVRYEQMLHTDKNLEPREARYYYKRLDKQKRKELRKKRRLQKKKQAEKEKGDQAWLKQQVEFTTNAIMEYIREEPLFTLNFKQVMLSDGILDRLEQSKVMKKPSRNTKNCYKKTVVEVSDKLAVWMDTITRFVDIQAIDSDEDIPPLTISSISLIGEEEEGGEGWLEEEGSEAKESEVESEILFQEQLFWGEGEEGLWENEYGVGVDKTEGEMISSLLFKKQEGGEDDELNMALLALLIEILESSPQELLESLVDEDKMPNVKYADVLDKLKALHSGELSKEEKKKPLEDVLADWAKKNDPEKVDDKLLKEIHNAAEILGEWWTVQPPFKKDIEEPTEPPLGDKGEEEVDEAEKQGEETEEGEGPATAEAGQEGDDEGDKDEPKDEAGEEEAETAQDIAAEAEGAEAEGAEAEGAEAEGAVAEAAEAEGAEAEAAEAEGAEVEGAEAEGAEGDGAGAEGEEAEDVEAEGAEVEGAEFEGEGEEEIIAEGGDTGTQLDIADLMELTEKLKEEEFLQGEEIAGEPYEITEAAGKEGEEEEKGEGEAEEMAEEEEEAKEISIIYEPGMEITAAELGKVIKGHKPSITFEHSPNTVCCLSLKTWAVWLLEITHNAHSWTKWVHGVIRQVREFAATIRGDVVGPDGKKKVLYKQNWRDFAKEVDDMIVAWRQYGAHVKELSSGIVDNFHGKDVKCCPKCLQDHLIKNVVTAHETLQALTEAMNCAGYWQRCLDEIVNKTSTLTSGEEEEKEIKSDDSSEEGDETDAYIEEVIHKGEEEDDEESVYEIEEVNLSSEPEDSRRQSRSGPRGSYRRF